MPACPVPQSSPGLPPRREGKLLAPAWLAALIAGHAVPHRPPGRWLVLEVGQDHQRHREAHIPGAVFLDIGLLERPPLWNAVHDDALLALFAGHGIDVHTTVVLYGRSQLCAARAAHLLLYAGVADVRLLDGGWQVWSDAGLPRQRGVQRARAVPSFGASRPLRPHLMWNTAQVRARDPRRTCLASIRTRAEHLGLTSGYGYIDARGDIPGASWGQAGPDGDVNSMAAYHGAGGRMRPPAEIAAMWQAHGIAPSRTVVFYCGTGWRASLAFYYAWLMGWEDIAVYDGGWLEWSGGQVLAAGSAAAAA